MENAIAVAALPRNFRRLKPLSTPSSARFSFFISAPRHLNSGDSGNTSLNSRRFEMLFQLDFIRREDTTHGMQ
jgi:hypothetical protein